MKEQVTEERASREPIRVVVIDGSPIVRTGIEGVLAGQCDRVRLVDHVNHDGAVTDVVSHLRPDVALVVFGGEQEHFRLASELEAEHCLPVLALSLVTDERWLYEALRRGVRGYVLMRIDGTQLAEALVQVSKGARVLDPDLAARVALSAAHAAEGRWPGSQFGLTRREADVLRLLADGLSNHHIAAELVLGEETVKTHLRKIYKKLGVHDRTQAVSFVLRKGLL